MEHYSTAERDLAAGDRILMYTDVMVETFNRNDEEFGSELLKRPLRAGTELSAAEIADCLLAKVKTLANIGNDGTLADDLTLIFIDVLPDANDHSRGTPRLAVTALDTDSDGRGFSTAS
jgi:serine phosphatase RsbU (regulator of sigma subunit)